jgi:Tol biopolymer transport system component
MDICNSNRMPASIAGLRNWRILLKPAYLLVALASLDGARLPAAAIFVMKTDGSEVRKVIEVPGFRSHGSPQWSHDGKRLVFDASPSGTGSSKFFVVNVDGTDLKELGEHAMPSWSPDDKQLAYQNYGSAGARAGTWVQNLDGAGRTWIVDGYSPRWSPDGSQIAYTDWRNVKAFDLVENEHRAFHDQPYDQIQVGFEWSPDGKRIAFVGTRNNQIELVIAGVGNLKVRLVRQSGLEGHVSWSPDGKRLVLIIDRAVYLLDAEGNRDPQKISGPGWKCSDAAWSPDGKWIALAAKQPNPE